MNICRALTVILWETNQWWSPRFLIAEFWTKLLCPSLLNVDSFSVLLRRKRTFSYSFFFSGLVFASKTFVFLVFGFNFDSEISLESWESWLKTEKRLFRVLQFLDLISSDKVSCSFTWSKLCATAENTLYTHLLFKASAFRPYRQVLF